MGHENFFVSIPVGSRTVAGNIPKRSVQRFRCLTSASFNSFTTVNIVLYSLHYYEYEFNKVFFVIGTVQKSKPDLEDVLDQLKQQSNKWNEIGGGLRVGFDFRQCQLRDGAMTTAQQKLEAVLNKWIESKCSEVSWNHLIQVLIDIELGGVADEVKSYLQTDPNAIKKYHWVNNIRVYMHYKVHAF